MIWLKLFQTENLNFLGSYPAMTDDLSNLFILEKLASPRNKLIVLKIKSMRITSLELLIKRRG